MDEPFQYVSDVIRNGVEISVQLTSLRFLLLSVCCFTVVSLHTRQRSIMVGLTTLLLLLLIFSFQFGSEQWG